MDTAQLFGTEKISKVLLRMAPPVMLAQLIQALYNIVDSLFVGRYGESGLTALSIIYPLQLLMIALAVGASMKSSLLTVVRTVVLFVPLAFLFSHFGLDWFWFTFPVTETVTTLVGVVFYRKFLKYPYIIL